jgi:proline iminopeptidase
MAAAQSWSTYEGACSTLLPSPETVAGFKADRMALGLSRIEAHFFVNDVFLPENALLEAIGRIRRIPAIIVQGRYDIVCPIRTADELTAAWPEAVYRIIPDAGHSAMEPGIRAGLVAAMEEFKDRG